MSTFLEITQFFVNISLEYSPLDHRNKCNIVQKSVSILIYS